MSSKIMCIGMVALTMAGSSFGADMCAATGETHGKAGAALTGVVLETTNASRYTYVQIDTGKEKIWAAGPAFQVKVGDRVTIAEGMLTKNFTSKALNRKFDDLYMASSIALAGSAAAQPAPGAGMPPGHPPVMGHGGAIPEVMPVIQKPEGGKTVAEIWADKGTLSGKTVILRAKVVKVSKNILGKNWLHLRDGTGVEGQNDLVVTTKDDVKSGDVVTVSGTLNTDKDFGSGYQYEAIMEDAAVIEK